MKKNENRSNCPISSSLDIFGDKWSLLIVRDLMLFRTCTYGDFTKSEEKIATNILANRLQRLEDNGIIVKLPYPNNKVKKMYQLTPKGIGLIPVLVEIALWGGNCLSNTDENSSFLKKVRKDKSKFVKNMMDRLREEYKANLD